MVFCFTVSCVALAIFVTLATSTPLLLTDEVITATRTVPVELESCTPSDFRCYNARALAYSNALRAVSRRPSLTMGTKSMLDAAVNHSRKMAADKNASKVMLDSIHVGCGTKLKKMKVMDVHKSLAEDLPDEAALCQSLWGNSDITSAEITEAVLGLIHDANGTVWCTELLANNTKFEESGPCSVAKEEEPTPEPSMESFELEPSMEPLISSTGYVFQNKWVKTQFIGGNIITMMLKCEKVCRYCSMDHSICLDEPKSIGVDIMATRASNK